jgi:hypothetical protein
MEERNCITRDPAGGLVCAVIRCHVEIRLPPPLEDRDSDDEEEEQQEEDYHDDTPAYPLCKFCGDVISMFLLRRPCLHWVCMDCRYEECVPDECNHCGVWSTGYIMDGHAMTEESFRLGFELNTIARDDQSDDKEHKMVALIHMGAFVDYRNGAGGGEQTALHWASNDGHPIAVRHLLWAGANPHLRGAFGETALRMAIKKNRWGVLHEMNRFRRISVKVAFGGLVWRFRRLARDDFKAGLVDRLLTEDLLAAQLWCELLSGRHLRTLLGPIGTGWTTERIFPSLVVRLGHLELCCWASDTYRTHHKWYISEPVTLRINYRGGYTPPTPPCMLERLTAKSRPAEDSDRIDPLFEESYSAYCVSDTSAGPPIDQPAGRFEFDSLADFVQKLATIIPHPGSSSD